MQLLYFHLGTAPYAIALDAVSEVLAGVTVRAIPLAPTIVRGITERRGRPIAVLDLPRLVDHTPAASSDPPRMVRLAPPLEGSALWVPARVQTGEGRPASGTDVPPGSAGHVWIDGSLHLLLDPEALVRKATGSA